VTSVPGRVAKGLGALVLMVAVTVGIPWLLLTIGRLPDPRTWTWASFVRLWTTPDSGVVLMMVITLVAWVAWAVFAASLVVELVNVASRQRLHLTLPGLRGPQTLAAGLVVAVATMIIAPLHAVAEPAPAPQPTKPDTLRVQDATTEQRDRTDRQVEHEVPYSAPAEQRQRPDSIVYTVKAGDDLWSLADRFYGEGGQWRRIADANRTKLTGGPDELIIGWKLTIPGVSGQAEPATRRSRTVTVRAGDTVSSLAQQHYGDPAAWRTIFDANRETIADPDQIDVGWKLVLPRTGPDQAASEKRPDEPADDSSGPKGERPVPEQEHRQSAPVPPPEIPTPEPTRPPTSPPTQPPGGAHADGSAGSDGTYVPADVAAVGAVGGLLAASLVAGLLARREWQLMNRPVGRRIPHPVPTAQLLEGALGRTSEPLTLASLDLALRAIAQHCRSTDTDVPELELVFAGTEQIDLRFAGDVPPAPVGFTAAETGWLVDRDGRSYLESVPGAATAPQLWPALISVEPLGEATSWSTSRRPVCSRSGRRPRPSAGSARTRRPPTRPSRSPPC